MKFSDIVLDEQDLEEIERRIDHEESVVYQGDMPARNKSILRQMLIKEMKEGIWANRDYVYGQDEGEPNKGDIQN